MCRPENLHLQSPDFDISFYKDFFVGRGTALTFDHHTPIKILGKESSGLLTRLISLEHVNFLGYDPKLGPVIVSVETNKSKYVSPYLRRVIAVGSI